MAEVATMPEVVDNVAVARLYGEPLFAMPRPPGLAVQGL